MSASNDLIERFEKETGQRLNVDDPNNAVVAGLMGALMRELGKTPPAFTERDDVAVGILLKHEMSEEGRRKRESDRALTNMLTSGVDPDALHLFRNSR